MAKLDHVKLMELLQTRANTEAPGVMWLWHGEDVEPGEFQEIVKVGVRITGDPNQQSSGPGARDLPITALVELTFVGYCSPTRLNADQEQGGSVNALAYLATTIDQAFGDALLEDADTTQQLETGFADIDLPVETDEQPGVGGCVVTVRGRWSRRAGASRVTV